MAARRLLIVMLILLGISTLAAALVPQSTLNDETTTRSTTTQATTTTTAAAPVPGNTFRIPLKLGGHQAVIACTAAQRQKGRCEPIHVGDRLSLKVMTRKPTQLSIDAYGLLGFAAPSAPAFFDLIVDSKQAFGITYQPSGKTAAQIRPGLTGPKKTPKKAKGPKRPARAEPGPA